ncbi:MAG TPA: hypothetical protein VFB38_16965 [Chthonomonadaceae bacterium]|nr:hypothetical protein [Chthonomonadaceae bacterium]
MQVTIRTDHDLGTLSQQFRRCYVCDMDYAPMGMDGKAQDGAGKAIGDVCPICLLHGAAFIEAALRHRANLMSLKANMEAMQMQQSRPAEAEDKRRQVAAELATLRHHAREGVTIMQEAGLATLRHYAREGVTATQAEVIEEVLIEETE